MDLDRFRAGRTLRRYRAMFQTSIGIGSIAAVLSAVGLAAWAVGPMPVYLPWSLLLLSIGGALGYKVVTSTARLLDREEKVPGE
jgi:hypothetical protein